MTTLRIVEEVRYRIDHDGTPAETMRAFLDNPNGYLTDVTERSVYIESPKLDSVEYIEAMEAINEVEMNA